MTPTQIPADTPEPAPLTPEDFDAQDAELDALREHDEEIPQWEFCEGFLA
ncbi:MAG TPA: zinc chelation protein SecC, partial [Ramlibacter sp.]|nr:zinc chelation protein SecC [Ramlibacter sp.]